MNYRFQNLLGAPYRGGDAVFAADSPVLLSAVGNRVASTDLAAASSFTLPFESSSNVTRLAASPSGDFLLAADDKGRALYANLRRRAVLHRVSFKGAPSAIRFSPDGKLIAVAVGKVVQIWRSPAFRKEFFPFHLLRTFPGFAAGVTSFDWSPDSAFLLASCKDLTARLLPVKKGLGGKPFLFLGHRAAVVGAFFATDKKGSVNRVYTIAKDGAIFTWNLVEGNDASPPPSPGTPEQESEQNDAMELDGESRKRKNVGDEDTTPLHLAKWELQEKHFFMQSPAKLTACDYHKELDMVVVGFSNGVFGLYQMPDFVCLHLLSISRAKITTAIFNSLGNWLVFGCAKLGQLLVWEWRSESYILKQQGHYFDVNCIAYSPDSQLLATGADDNKIKVWTVSSGFCFITFSEHTNAVTALHFMANNHSLLSASLDGTIRAWDLFRYRNFRTFTTPSPRQFVSLTADQSGEVICAGTLDSFEIFVWSMKTGRLLDILSGHEGPVHGLMFSPISAILASSSWDKTVRLWDVFESKGAVETFQHSHDVLTLAYRPDGKQIACRLASVILDCISSRTLSIRIAQCFLLNGLIFLGSLFTLKSVVIPTLLWILPEECNQSEGQHLCDHKVAVATYSFLRSGLIEIFYVFWFYPLYIFSFILSALWYNDIAKHALDVVKSKSLDSTQVLDSHNTIESEDQPEGFDRVALGIGEQVYSILLLTILFVEVSVIGYIPYFGKAMNFVLLSLMYAYYCFEYKWNFFAVNLNKRLDYFESNWAFFAGFGGPCVLPIFFLSPLTSYGVMAILYPLFVLTAAGTQVEQVINGLEPSLKGKLKRIPVFFVAKRLTTQVLQLFPDARKEQ